MPGLASGASRMIAVYGLKTKAYRFRHNFGHGKQRLANLFATMILLAFLPHTTLDKIDQTYRAVRDRLPSRRTFFEHSRALLRYLPFADRDHLMNFMPGRLDAPTPDRHPISCRREEAISNPSAL